MEVSSQRKVVDIRSFGTREPLAKMMWVWANSLELDSFCTLTVKVASDWRHWPTQRSSASVSANYGCLPFMVSQE